MQYARVVVIAPSTRVAGRRALRQWTPRDGEGGRLGRVRLASRETCASRRSCLRRTEGEGGVINQRTEAGRKEVCVWCDCGGWTEGTFSGRISMCGVCVCVVCATERARHASAAGSGMATRCGEGRERATALTESWGERGKRGRPPEASRLLKKRSRGRRCEHFGVAHHFLSIKAHI